jgi:hypothetical protein
MHSVCVSDSIPKAKLLGGPLFLSLSMRCEAFVYQKNSPRSIWRLISCYICTIVNDSTIFSDCAGAPVKIRMQQE